MYIFIDNIMRYELRYVLITHVYFAINHLNVFSKAFVEKLFWAQILFYSYCNSLQYITNYYIITINDTVDLFHRTTFHRVRTISV